MLQYLAFAAGLLWALGVQAANGVLPNQVLIGQNISLQAGASD